MSLSSFVAPLVHHPYMRLYSDVMHSIFGYLTIDDVTSASSTHYNWYSDAVTMRRRDASVVVDAAQLSRMPYSHMRKHVTSIVVTSNDADSVRVSTSIPTMLAMRSFVHQLTHIDCCIDASMFTSMTPLDIFPRSLRSVKIEFVPMIISNHELSLSSLPLVRWAGIRRLIDRMNMVASLTSIAFVFTLASYYYNDVIGPSFCLQLPSSILWPLRRLSSLASFSFVARSVAGSLVDQPRRYHDVDIKWKQQHVDVWTTMPALTHLDIGSMYNYKDVLEWMADNDHHQNSLVRRLQHVSMGAMIIDSTIGPYLCKLSSLTSLSCRSIFDSSFLLSMELLTSVIISDDGNAANVDELIQSLMRCDGPISIQLAEHRIDGEQLQLLKDEITTNNVIGQMSFN